MATPPDPSPYRQGPDNRRTRTRAAAGAGIGALALAGGIIAAPTPAVAQDNEMETANAWVTDQINADGAWETTKGEGATVAVVDSGIAEHPYFEDKSIERGHSVYSDEDDAWNDNDGHGTGVASMVLSIAPEATILPVRTSNNADLEGLSGGVGEGEAVEGIRWAADNGADVICLAWVSIGYEPSDEYLEVLQYAMDKDVVVVAGAGNDPGLEAVPPPAGIPGVVAVAGTDEDGNSWSGGTTGEDVELAAPASVITTAALQEESLGWGDDSDQTLYQAREGTSLATGLASGAAALVSAANPELDANNVIQQLVQTADGNGGHSNEYGNGRIDLSQAVNSQDVEYVEENPLGYPMGEPGASGAEPDDTEDAESNSGAGEQVQEPSAAAGEDSDSNLSTVLIISAAAGLVVASIVVWLVLRSRSKRAAMAGTGANPGHGGVPLYGPRSQQFSASPCPPPQGVNPNPSPSAQQKYSPPTSGGQESNPPWGPGDPNQRPQ